MKKIKLLSILVAIMMLFSLNAINAEEEKKNAVDTYKEVFSVENDVDAKQVVEVSVYGNKSYLEVIKSVKDSELVSVEGENIETEYETFKNGTVTVIRSKIIDVTKPASMKVVFKCLGFYDITPKAANNGGLQHTMSYKFTNHLDYEIKKYTVSIDAPKGMVIEKVSSPKEYAKYKLAENDEIKSVSNSTGLKASAANTLTFDYNPAKSTTSNIAVWTICLGIGAFVFVDRLKKESN